MPTTFRLCQPDQLLLLSPDVRERHPSGHPAHHVSDLVDALDLSASCATGVLSSRAIARKPEEDVAFRVLGAENLPQHRTTRGQSCLGLGAPLRRTQVTSTTR